MKFVLSPKRWFGAKQAPMPIGVEFGSDALHMVQYQPNGSRFEIRAATSVPYMAPREDILKNKVRLRKLVRQAVASAPFIGRRVHSSLPTRDVRIVPLTVSVAAGQKEPAAVVKALRDKLRSDLSEDVIDYLPVRSFVAAGSEISVLAAVARREAVLSHLEMIERSGLEPVSVDVGPAALARLLANMHDGEHNQSLLLINFGIEKSYITVVWGRRLMLDREVPFGLTSLLDQLIKALDIDSETAQALLQNHASTVESTEPKLVSISTERIMDEVLYSQFNILAEEVGKTLVYIASKTHGGQTKAIYINGSLAQYDYVRSKTQSLFDVPVKTLNPLRIFAPTGKTVHQPDMRPHAALALAAGLALRG